MNKEIEILKVSNYDKFKCIADKCKFTCCEGWDVSIDTDTYNKWKKKDNNSEYILNNVKVKKCGDKKEYFINKETHEVCPLLDKQGLCQLVKKYGEDYLSLACHTFPRIENTFEGEKELSLSCACPEVVEIISSITGKINMISESNVNFKSDLLEVKVRDAIVNLIQEEDILIEDKLIISFQILLNILENKNIREENLLEELARYKSKEYIQELIGMYHKIKLDTDESIEEITNLFLDITENYKEVHSLSMFLEDISDFAEEVDIESLADNWKDYKKLFDQYNILIENCIVSKVLSNCVSDDIEEMIISFQMIIIEYLLVRYAVFLKYSMSENKEINIKDVKEYIVCFSRVIGNNTEAVIEFFRDGFGEDVLEIGYLCFITLF